MSIERYALDTGEMEVHRDGGYVLHADYAEMEARCAALAAENAALKSGVTYFAFAPEYGFDYFTNKQDAIDTAQAEINAYRDDAFDGWDEDVRRVSWGIVIQQADGFDAEGVHISDKRHTYQTCDYQLIDTVETPATDAFLAEVRAQGVEGFIAFCGEENSVFVESKAYYRSLPDAVAEFAAQLRQEAK